jgi:hypothetical protein
MATTLIMPVLFVLIFVTDCSQVYEFGIMNVYKCLCIYKFMLRGTNMAVTWSIEIKKILCRKQVIEIWLLDLPPPPLLAGIKKYFS